MPDYRCGVSEQKPYVPKNYDPTTFRDKPVSFVRRSGRMTSGQQRGWDDLSDFYLIDVPHGPAATSVAEGATGDPAELFGRSAPLVIEVGSGQGHAIIHAAASHPEKNFLAVEVFQAGLARTMTAADEEGVRNLRLAEVNAPELLERYLPAGSADELWVFFPDPWAKVRHRKRRLIDEEFSHIAARVLRPGGLLRLATDWQNYADQMREVLDAAPGFARDFTGEWAERFDGRVLTAFENKGTAKGRAIRDLTYRRV
ncbi:tRNA (guanine-N7-)-methyltransferase [Leucobacter luti]|uniref:tRNA (guanine-N(7)-)-methyltransferase n=1 Tax=Leucobacter luti TaxID=340320 RepID=A0A4R6RXD6_9MICO|nr:tRNA (guanine-N7-)-methyltransferase [Leucobacter luti]TDP91653.1 tRNA (guanine-N7-)-methyltransferase [Leucobacter luti]